MLTLSNLSLFRTCWATNRDASMAFSISRIIGFSNVGLRSGQHVGLRSSLLVGLKRSSSPPGNGSAGSGGSPKHGPIPPEAATSNRDGGRTLKYFAERKFRQTIQIGVPFTLGAILHQKHY